MGLYSSWSFGAWLLFCSCMARGARIANKRMAEDYNIASDSQSRKNDEKEGVADVSELLPASLLHALATSKANESDDSFAFRKLLRRSSNPGDQLDWGNICPFAIGDMYTLGSKIGEGGYGVVYRAVKMGAITGSFDHAVKKVKWAACTKTTAECIAEHDDIDKNAIGSRYGFDPNELRPMQMGLPFVANLDDVFYVSKSSNSGDVYIANRFYAGGDLRHFLHKQNQLKDAVKYLHQHGQNTNAQERFSVQFSNTVKEIAAQVAYGLWELQKKGILWGDLKEDNILIVDSQEAGKVPRIVLTDFGLAKIDCGAQACTKGLMGTPWYMSPGIFALQPFGYEIDWWAYGIMLSGMIGCKPYPTPLGSEGTDLLVKIITTGPNVTCIEDPRLKAFVSKLLHPYFNATDKTKNIDQKQIVYPYATDEQRKLMASKNASQHPVLSDSFFHDLTDAADIDEFWKRKCREYAADGASCEEPSPTPLCSVPGPDQCSDLLTNRPERKQWEVCTRAGSLGKFYKEKGHPWQEKTQRQHPGKATCASACNYAKLRAGKKARVCSVAIKELMDLPPTEGIKRCRTRFPDGAWKASASQACCQCLAKEDCSNNGCIDFNCGSVDVIVSEPTFGMSISPGTATVYKVTPNTQAERAGVRIGCVVKSINNKDVDADTWLEAFRNARKPFRMHLSCYA